MLYKIWFAYLMFWYLPWCVPDSTLVCMWDFSNRKVNFFFALCLFSISLVSSFFIYIEPAFAEFLQNIETSLEASSLPATSVHQDDTLTYVVFVLDTLNYFLLLAYISLRASNFVLVTSSISFCLPQIFA